MADDGGAGLNVGNELIHAAGAVGDVGHALADAITGDGHGAEHELDNLVADGFEAIPGHELAWDGLSALGYAADGPHNEVKTWDEGGEEQFRDAVGADPEQDVTIPVVPQQDYPEA